MKSQFLKLNFKDVVKGSIVVLLTTILSSVITIIQVGSIPSSTDIKGILATACTAGFAYFVKNLFTNSNDEIAKEPEQPDTIS